MPLSKPPECPQHKKPMTPSVYHIEDSTLDESGFIDDKRSTRSVVRWLCPDCGTSYLNDYLQMIQEYADKSGKTLEQLTEDPFID